MAEEMRINRVNNGWHVVRYGQGGRVGCTEQHVFEDTNEGRMGLSDWVVGWIAETSQARIPVFDRHANDDADDGRAFENISDIIRAEDDGRGT